MSWEAKSNTCDWAVGDTMASMRDAGHNEETAFLVLQAVVSEKVMKEVSLGRAKSFKAIEFQQLYMRVVKPSVLADEVIIDLFMKYTWVENTAEFKKLERELMVEYPGFHKGL